MTAELGYLALVLAWAAAVFAAFSSSVGATYGMGRLVASGRRALLAAAGLSTVAVGALLVAFARHDFSIAYVWQTSSTTTPPFYLVTAVWGGQSGSLLFWSWTLALFAATAIARRWRADAALMPWFTAVCGAVLGFFLTLTAFVANPFERLTVLPFEGNGLNPLLQHPGMAFHPPMLYLGLTGLTIPYAFAMAALLARRTDAGWILASRRWTLVAWAFLSIGLALGARWAYDVLGWGGYWGWDPVENAAFMPWLAATAFLHSVMVQERRGMFRVWNMVLMILTFGLVIIGTFLTRAGLVASVHSFAQSDIGPYFLVFTAVLLVGSLALLWTRLSYLRSDGVIDAVLSRETAFLANNVVFMGALFGVFWGTLFPLVSEIVTGQRVTVGPPYFNRVVLPVLWVALLLMAVAPAVGWRRARAALVARALRGPAAVAALLGVALVALGVRQPVALVAFTTCAFALLTTLAEMARAARARMARGEAPHAAVGTLFRRNRRRYGGYVVHLGVVLLAAGVVGSNVYQQETERTLAVGETLRVGAYRLTYEGLRVTEAADRRSVAAVLQVRRDGRVLGSVLPRRDVFRLREDQPMTIPAVMSRPLEDVYTMIGVIDPDTERVTVKAVVNPLIGFVWLGMIVLVAGTLVAAWPDGSEARVMNAELRRLLGTAVPARGA